jgi:hypothetical protein
LHLEKRLEDVSMLSRVLVKSKSRPVRVHWSVGEIVVEDKKVGGFGVGVCTLGEEPFARSLAIVSTSSLLKLAMEPAPGTPESAHRKRQGWRGRERNQARGVE